MIIKINGIRDPELIEQLKELNPTYLAFDFRHHSIDYIGEVDEAIYSKIPIKIRKSGIFENDDPLYIIAMAGRFSLSTVELCGDESHFDCELLAAEGVEVIKVIDRVSQIEKYEGICNKFIVRDRDILNHYGGKTTVISSWKIANSGVYGVEVMQNELKSEEWKSFLAKY